MAGPVGTLAGVLVAAGGVLAAGPETGTTTGAANVWSAAPSPPEGASTAIELTKLFDPTEAARRPEPPEPLPPFDTDLVWSPPAAAR